MKKILWIGDFVTPTGFARVNENIIKYLDKSKFEVHVVGINYFGDPHGYKDIQVYPAFRGGDIYGIGRLEDFSRNQIDTIFILNDLPVLAMYLAKIKEHFNPVPNVVVYFPIDSASLDVDWFKDFDIVSSVNTYTEFGKQEVLKVYEEKEVNVVPHGVDTRFFELDHKSARERLFKDKPDFDEDAFIVLNANRNQPRKRLDLSLQGFALFAKGKPKNVKYYHHAGTKDMGWDVIKLAKRLDIEDRLVLTSLESGIQKVSEEVLNVIYNACDVGINTSWGEGWGLTSVEHSTTGAVQVVPKHSACEELFHDVGRVVPISMEIISDQTLSVGGYVHPRDVASHLNVLYHNPELKVALGKAGQEKFLQPMYHWSNIASAFAEVL